MKDRCMRFRAVLLAALIVLGTALLAGPVSARADALPSADAETAASGQPSREPNEPAPDGTIYNTVQHFLYHVASRDPYSFYSTIPCTGELRECIGYLLDAFRYGAPPHGGMGLGLDRLIMQMLGCESLRDVIAYPKVQNASEPMTDCPALVDEIQLRDLGITGMETGAEE